MGNEWIKTKVLYVIGEAIEKANSICEEVKLSGFIFLHSEWSSSLRDCIEGSRKMLEMQIN